MTEFIQDPISAAKEVHDRACAIRGAIGMITEEELAAVLLLNSVGTLATWRSQDKGPESVKLGKRVFYSVGALSQWINTLNQAQNAPAPAAPADLQAAA